jgi:glycosyltransferase involved in cell wall biosynthesis
MAVAGAAPLLSIVIPCLGHAQELVYCLEGLDAQEGGLPFEVIVVDSASDPAVQAAAARFPVARLVQPANLLSAGAARNLGAKQAASQVLGFIDADCIPQRGWVRATLEAIQGGAALASGPILDVLPWHCIAASDNRLQFVDFPRRRPAGVHPYFPAAHLAMPRTVFESSGGFDPDASGTQDVVLTSSVAAAWPEKVRFCPQMVVRHWGRQHWSEFLSHQHTFGSSRAEYRLRMDKSLIWLGRHPALGWIVFLRRLLYITLRVIQWNLADLPRFVLQLPVLMAGLIAWTRGFYAGMRATPPESMEAGRGPGD